MLTVREVSFTYKGHGKGTHVSALKRVTFDITDSSFVILTGRTGSGKSTLLQLLCGLIEPDGGEIHCEDGDLFSKSSMIFQYPEDCFFNPTVMEELEFGLKTAGKNGTEKLKAITEVIGFDLEKFSSRTPFSLSGGEQRLLAIASMVVLDNAILLLDEPTSGLDDRAVQRVRNLLLSEYRLGKTIVVSTHWPAEFLDMATHVMNLRDGSLEYFVTVEDYVDSNLHNRQLEEKEKYLIDYYKRFKAFPENDEELIEFVRREKKC
ncbi:cobalt ABC transporter ATPase [Mesotoga sp. H07pep.5.4]|uniref:energy-coupling factor ABC transporter ATP-binding protein n=1 Tax=Mesotoga sp. H07pep.5.4 TaxID=1463664 RepID=UPI000EF15013|nr:ABC transporter ATP-binding protein [Mesotoga sp. H07pep.5.4]RLL86953.1 cobalt ABC transporter ATPase [Mesotoga sp. H07pep.5.4]